MNLNKKRNSEIRTGKGKDENIAKMATKKSAKEVDKDKVFKQIVFHSFLKRDM